MDLFVDQLKNLGLNTYEAKAYKTLLEQGTSTAYTIAKISGVPQGKIYPVLDDLKRKNAITIHAGMPKQYTPTSPDILFENCLKQREEETKRFRWETAKFLTSVSTLRPATLQEPDDVVEVYKSFETTLRRSQTLHDQSNKYWKSISMVRPRKEHLDSVRRAIKRGVLIQTITSFKYTTPARIREFTKRGVQVRLLEDLPVRMSIYDDKGVIFRFEHEKQYTTCHIKNSTLATQMRKIFDEYWKKAKQFDD